ncbi:hypothetical protein PHPALM_27999 [Phytophthora palmivora]|uniref:M96 mating-specific protein family n=1 Tax=Phytophthora palmivora TaxID=4796 RepID=A0A2P4XB61_9STRA|nr:hypothetical protein PHPALM_27999 [Phytophthora palmivora]
METRVVFLKMKKSLSTSGFEVEKKVALREKKKCLDAQEENKQLKTKLKFYSRQYETFQKTLAEFQQKELERVISGDLRVEIATGKQVQMFGCHLFDTMEGRLDARFHELEHAFQVMQQPMTSTDTDIIQTKNEKRGAVEFTRLELLPFENSAISATMWSAIEAGKFPDGEHSIVRRRSGDSVAVSTRVTVQASCGEVVIIDTHSVMKRFVTPQGNAFITEACSDWNVNSPALGAWRHSTREEGCFVVRSYDASPRFIPSLRTETQTLETRVAFLKLRATHAKLYEAFVTTTEEQQLWKATAMVERQKSQQAQEKNSELKLMIKRCKKTCDALQTALSTTNVKHMEVTMNTITARSLRVEMNTGYKLQTHSAAVFNWLKCRLSVRVCELEPIFRKIKVFTDSDHAQVDPRNCVDTASIAEFKHTRMLPFSANRTSGVAWEIMKLGGFPNECSATEHPDDILASEGCSSHPLNCGGTAELRSHCLKKKVAIPGGFAVLVESISEWLANPSSSDPWSYVTQESGWAFVYPLETKESANLCRIQTMLRLTTADSAEVGHYFQKQSLTQFTNAVGDVVIPSFRELLNSRHQLLDNALLDSPKSN